MPHGNSKIREEQLIEELNKGKKGKEIAEEWGLDPTTVSEKINGLEGVELYTSTTANSSGAGILVTLSRKLLERAGLKLEGNTLYYSREVKPSGLLVVEFSNEREEGFNKLSSANSLGDKTVSVTGSQLSEMGFDSNEGIYVKKKPKAGQVFLYFSDKKAVEVES